MEIDKINEIEFCLLGMIDENGVEPMLKAIATTLAKVAWKNKAVIEVVVSVENEPFTMICTPGSLLDEEEVRHTQI